MSMRSPTFVLLFLIGVIALVAAIAQETGLMDRFGEYRARSALSEVHAAASTPRLAVSEFWLNRSRMPVDADELEAASPGATRSLVSSIERIEIRGGTVVMELGSQAGRALRGQVLALSPCLSARQGIEWVCGMAVCMPPLLAAPGAPPAFSLTTMADESLPASCRGPGREVLLHRDRAEAGDIDGRTMWAAFHWDGHFVPRDPEFALREAREAARAGSAGAMGLLGHIFAHGDEQMQPDLLQAHMWLERAIGAGHPTARGMRSELEARMDAAQLEEARAAARARRR